ncbi:hypothetical protein ACOMHN_016190 [Nucella lapillus]
MANLVAGCQLLRSADSASEFAGAVPPALKFRLHTSLYRSAGVTDGCELGGMQDKQFFNECVLVPTKQQQQK